jgi:hypothetical protein
MEKLRPNKNNGDALALGSIALALAVLMLTIRLGGPWASGVNLAYTAIAAALVLGLAYLTPTGSGRPAPYLTAIFVAGYSIAVIAILNLADVLGADGLEAGTRVWILALLLGIAIYIALFYNSGVFTLLAGLVGIGLILSLVDWIFTPDDPVETYRWILVLIVLVYLAIAVLEIVPETYRQVAIVDAAGFALLALAFTFLSGVGGLDIGSEGTSAGWEIAILIGSVLLIGYAFLAGDPGPGYLGGFNIAAFGVIAAATDEASVLWWPAILIAVAVAAVAAAFTGVAVPKLSEARSLRK